MKNIFALKKILVLAFMFLCASFAFTQTVLNVGDAAPAFSVTTLDGKILTNLSFKKQAIFLHFWGTWCPPCRAELPHINALAEKINTPKSKIAFVAVAVSDTPAQVKNFMKRNNYNFTSALDATNEISSAYAIQAVPTSILISPDGKIEKIQVGAMSKKQLEQFVSAYVK